MRVFRDIQNQQYVNLETGETISFLDIFSKKDSVEIYENGEKIINLTKKDYEVIEKTIENKLLELK